MKNNKILIICLVVLVIISIALLAACDKTTDKSKPNGGSQIENGDNGNAGGDNGNAGGVLDGNIGEFTISEGMLTNYSGSARFLTVPNGVIGIDKNVFSGNTKLMSINLPISLTSIGSSAFSGCSSLTSITIPNGVTSIGESAFSGCTSLSNATILDGLKSVDSKIFENCTNLTNVTLPDSIENIAKDAFAGCNKLKYTRSGNADYLNNHLIKAASNRITASDIKQGTITIAGNAFYNCKDLASVTIPDSVTSIGESAFSGCSGLTSVTIPESVMKIGESAFSGCTGLTSATAAVRHFSKIPKANLTDIVITNGEPDADFLGNGVFGPEDKISNLFGRNDSELLKELTTVTFGEGVTEIGEFAFSCCDKLTKVNLSKNIKQIYSTAFSFCTSLKSITIPKSVEKLYSPYGGAFSEASAFFGCGLNSIEVESGNEFYHSNGNCIIETETKTLVLGCNDSVIPNDGSVTSIGDYAFYDCSSLTGITIPDSVTSIGLCAFSGCSGLTSINVESGNARYHSKDNCLIEKATKTLIQGCNNSVIPTDGSVTSIGDYAFFDCSGLTSITIPDGVTSIGRCAFYVCSGLTSINIPDSVTSIGGDAFRGCSSLTSITIPNSVTSMGRDAFSGCSGLTIYAEAEKIPRGWDIWNPDNRPVVWGHKG